MASDAAAAPSSTGSWLDFLTGLVPANVLGLEGSAGDDGSISMSFNVLQILVVAIAIGIATLKVSKAADQFLTFVRSALAVVQKVLWWIILLAPIATIGLLGNAVAAYGWDALGSLGSFTPGDLCGAADRPARRLPDTAAAQRPVRQAVLHRRLARHHARLRLPLVGGHDAGHRGER